MSSISAVVITFNEEKNIERCLQSLEGIADEVIVMDSLSSDRTVEICQKYGAIVYQEPWQGYSASKNKANAFASCSYILSLDADEALDESLRREIILLKNKGLKGVYSLNRLTNYCGKWVYHSGWYPDVKERLFPKEGTKWVGEFVHEELSFIENHDRTLLKGHLLHYSYYSRIEHRQRADKYSILTAQKFYNQGKRASLLKPYFSGAARFISMFFLKKGFLDGVTGFQIAWISAQSNVLKYAELRRLQNGK